jgi:hypothetical protein
MSKQMLVFVAVFLLLSVAELAPWARGDTFTFTDGFEGTSFNPFWTLTQQLGTITLSTDETFTGSQSAKFTAGSGGQRNLFLTHTFSSEMVGTVSVYFFDAAPGEQTLYEKLSLSDSQNGTDANVGTQDFDAFCYSAAIGAAGPNANCGQFPQESTTDVMRTEGWHLLSITAGLTDSFISIDGNQVFNLPGPFTFDTVQLEMFGPGFRPNAVAYFDDFSITSSTVPEPRNLGWVMPALFFGGLAFHTYVRKKKLLRLMTTVGEPWTCRVSVYWHPRWLSRRVGAIPGLRLELGRWVAGRAGSRVPVMFGIIR